MGSNWKHVCPALWQRVTRKKPESADDAHTHLRRCLSTARLTFIGIGKTVGVGIYVLIGVATKEYAGPGVLVSFVLAAFVTLLNALCLAEFASKSTKTGAQYTYMYESVGEGVAFLTGWLGLLGFVSAHAIAAKGWSGYVDALFNNVIKNYTISHIGHYTVGSPFSDYPDLLAVLVVILVMIITVVGVNYSSLLNSILATVSGTLLIFISISGLFYADISNWTNVGHGGFFPHGLKGVLAATSACFYAYQGFDVIAFSAEEAKDPQKQIPRAIIFELFIVTLLYLGVSISFTLMQPYWLVDVRAPYPGAYAYHNVTWAKYIVAVGPVLALTNLCILEMYALTRLSYSMATDGLLFSIFSRVNQRTKVPVYQVMVFGPIIIALVLSLDLKNLVGFMVICSFMTFTLFSSYIIIMRYGAVSGQTNNDNRENIENNPASCHHQSEQSHDDPQASDGLLSYNEDDRELLEISRNTSSDSLVNTNLLSNTTPIRDNIPSQQSKTTIREKINMFVVSIRLRTLLLVIVISSLLLSLLLVHGADDLMQGRGLSLYSAVVLVILLYLSTMAIFCRTQTAKYSGFKVPGVPFTPVLTILCNMMLLVAVADKGSVTVAVVLCAIGAVVYAVIVVVDVIRNGYQPAVRQQDSREYARLLDEDMELEVQPGQ